MKHVQKSQSPTDTGWKGVPHPTDPQNGQPGMVRNFQAGGLSHQVWLYPDEHDQSKFYLSHTTYEPESRTLTEYRKPVPGGGPFNGGNHARDAVKRLQGGHTGPLPGYTQADQMTISEEQAREMFPHHYPEPTTPPAPGTIPGPRRTQ